MLTKLTKANKKVEEYNATMTFDLKIIVEEADERYTAFLRIGYDGQTNFLYSAPKTLYKNKQAFIDTVQGMLCVRTIVNYYWWLMDDDECECDEDDDE